MSIDTIRHSLSHIMASAVQELYPGVKFGIGPAIENGFYYDFDLPEPLTSEVLSKIEEKMKKLIKQNIRFKKKMVSKKEAKKIFKNQPYKLELIEELSRRQATIYQSGEFFDLCRGPHVKSTSEIPIDAFKLTRIAGAYWRGDEKNPMLTRIYGMAFGTKKELENYFKLQEEAEKRDHRMLGQKLDLFSIDEEVGPGLVLWHPKGATLRQIIEDFWTKEHLNNGYEMVRTPHLGRIKLWQTSGHTDFYRENMFGPMEVEGDKYLIKPMNCPFHIKIYKTQTRSYRDLPLRWAELGTVYRYERSGVLYGLVRVRGFTQDDAHIICMPEQLTNEVMRTVKFGIRLLKNFGLKEFNIYLATQPKKDFVGSPKNWKKAENSLKYALKKMKLKYRVDPGGGAFYGPKIDIKIKDAVGREWQCTTVQFDFNLPERFDLFYIDDKGRKQRPYMVHHTLLGAIERFVGVLLEHYAGALPLWLSPEQIWIIPVGSRHEKYANEVARQLTIYNLRTKMKDENETVSKKIRDGELQKIPYLLVVGDKESKNKSVRVRKRGKGDIGEIKLTKFIKEIQKELQLKKFQ